MTMDNIDQTHLIYFADMQSWNEHYNRLPDDARKHIDIMGYSPQMGRVLVVPNVFGIAFVLLGIGTREDLAKNPFLPAKLVAELPKGMYCFMDKLPDPELTMIGVRLACYKFTAFKDAPATEVVLSLIHI